MNSFGPSVRGLWALLWRSVVLLPVGVAQFALICYAWIGLLALPVAAGIFIWSSDWWLAAVCIPPWVLSWFCVRWYWRWQRSDDFNHRGDI